MVAQEAFGVGSGAEPDLLAVKPSALVTVAGVVPGAQEAFGIGGRTHRAGDLGRCERGEGGSHAGTGGDAQQALHLVAGQQPRRMDQLRPLVTRQLAERGGVDYPG